MSVVASSDAVPATEVYERARAVGAAQRGRLRTPVDIEIVIPAYNESARLPETLRQSVAYLDGQPWRSRLVVVDNGSVDETAADARIAAAGTDKVDVAVIGCSRAGKGAAVRRGLLTSTSPLVGFYDADLATPLETLAPTVEALRAGADAVIASRHADGSSFVIPQPLRRRLGGDMFRLLTRKLVPGVADTQCGFKFFRREIVQTAIARVRTTGFAFDVELLAQVQLAGGKIVELPVAWTDAAGSTFHPVRDGLASFRAVFDLRGSVK
jgi:glycosyltransferase involved in cell wall biosynthesis